jgi:hypothetical protein
MLYKVFYTDVPLPIGMNEPDFSRLMPFAFPTLNEAVKKAGLLLELGAVVWKIDGLNGVEMDRAAIERVCGKEKLRFTLGPGPIVTSTGGMPHKQHKDRNVQTPRKPPG